MSGAGNRPVGAARDMRHMISQTASGVRKENGGAPEGVRRKQISMLNILERPALGQRVNEFIAEGLSL